MAEQSEDDFVPPYISFAQLENVLERMRNEGTPARIDRSYLASWSGSAQAQFLKATASLGLRDDHGRPTETLKQLVENPDGRPAIIASILQDKYAAALVLGEDATQQQLEEVFRNYPGISGSTTRKSITFYLHAAKFAGIPVSPFFKSGRATPGGGGGSRPSRSRTQRRGSPPATVPISPSQSPANSLPQLHPAVLTLVQALPTSNDPAAKPEFSEADREAWFAYARATFNLIYALAPSDTGGST
jgi:Family of unknown function (DUF5343)